MPIDIRQSVREYAYILQPAIFASIIQAVTHHEFVGYREADVLGSHRFGPPYGRLVQQGAESEACRLARQKITGQELIRETCIDYVLDNENIFATNVRGEYGREVYCALTAGLLITRGDNEIKLGRQTEIPNEVRQEDDRPFEDAYQQEVLVLVIPGDISRQFPHTVGNLHPGQEYLQAFISHNPL